MPDPVPRLQPGRPLPDTIRYEIDAGVLIVTIDRPEVSNALTPEMLIGLEDAFAEFEADDRLLVAILTGIGDSAFCAGGDLAETLPLVTRGEFRIASDDPTKRFFSDVYKPIIAAVNGVCIAGGLEMLQGTDLRIAAEHAVFGLGEVRWGLVAAGGSHVRLPRQIPWAVAMELLLTGRPISAARAFDIGMVNAVVPAAELMTEARKLAELIGRNGPLAVRTAKEIAVRASALDNPFALESALSERVFRSADAAEGPAAFIARRTPRFTGR